MLSIGYRVGRKRLDQNAFLSFPPTQPACPPTPSIFLLWIVEQRLACPRRPSTNTSLPSIPSSKPVLLLRTRHAYLSRAEAQTSGGDGVGARRERVASSSAGGDLGGFEAFLGVEGGAGGKKNGREKGELKERARRGEGERGEGGTNRRKETISSYGRGLEAKRDEGS